MNNRRSARPPNAYFGPAGINPRTRFSRLCDPRETHARLFDGYDADPANLISLANWWVSKERGEWDKAPTANGRYGRLFYRDRLYPDVMLRFVQLQEGSDLLRTLVLARIYLSEDMQRKGYFTALREGLERSAASASARFMVEQANENLGARLERRGYEWYGGI